MKIVESEVVRLYSQEDQSTHFIAKKYGTYPNKIRRILIKNGVTLKDARTAQKIALKKGHSKHPTEGRKRTTEEKLKISSSVVEYRKGMTDEEKAVESMGASDRWNSMTPAKRQDIRNKAAAAIRVAAKEGSQLEKFLVEELRKAGYRTEVHKKNLIPTQKLEIDIYIPALKTIIEIDGPSHFLPIWGDEKFAKQLKADAQKNGLVVGKGFVMIRVKNLHNSISLHVKESLKNQVLDIVASIEDKFPTSRKRLIEIEI
jgi:very-short-patch-repair endonuclease